FNMSKFWEHNLLVAIVAKKITENQAGYNDIFTIAILHDIGKLIIRQYLHIEFLKIFDYFENNSINFIEAEKKVLEANHAQIGSWLCKKWNFPEEIVLGVNYHHNAFDENSNDYAKLIFLADSLVNNAGYSYPKNKNYELNIKKLHKLVEFSFLKKVTKNKELFLDLEYYENLTENMIEESEEFISML
ncbi:MAG: HDOD domain-containing protein, partial [Candidatus Cloacimonadota bacterium]|nr:HDOD domain-containing protein [Candidatus Cloacimonadota bacterium]